MLIKLLERIQRLECKPYDSAEQREGWKVTQHFNMSK